MLHHLQQVHQEWFMDQLRMLHQLQLRMLYQLQQVHQEWFMVQLTILHKLQLRMLHQLQQPGTSTEHVVTRASKRKIGEADPSQFQHHSKGKWLRWKGNAAVTTRQLQENVETVRKKRGRPLKSQTLGAQSSQT
ncbi:hypothetical protein V6N11_083107 [Hibiscus sabdariffa]|uniref:Uncharacterized protein n=1 Tax=Hibiscus sabdariffa TaxID=183260 RepID=A0ABR2QKV4_9ROSI